MNRTLFAKELRANLFVSLIIAAIITFFVFVILSRTVGLALTLAGVVLALKMKHR